MSVLALWIRSTFWGTVGVMALMAAAELALVRWALGTFPEIYEWSGLPMIWWFSEVMEKAHLPMVFTVGALALLCLWLAPGTGSRYTLGRLSVREEIAVLWQAVCYAGWLLILWAVQLGAVLAAFRWYVGYADPAQLSGQTMFLDAYDSQFFHWLLPLDDHVVAVAVVVLVVSLGFALAVDNYRQRRGSRAPVVSILMAAVLPVLYNTQDDAAAWYLMAVCTVLDVVQGVRLERGWREGDET